MSAGSSSLGRRVLELTTDASKLRQGLSDARVLTIQQTAKLKADARIQLTADLLRLKADFRQGERDAVSAKRLIETQTRYKASIDLAQFRSDLRVQEREAAASARRNQALANYYHRPAAQPAAQSAAAGGGLGIGAALGLGAAGGAAGAFAGAALGFGQRAVADTVALAGAVNAYGAALQQTESRIKGFTGSTAELAKTQTIANKEAAAGRGVYSETLAALADLTPLANRYNESLTDVLHTAQLLAAADPAQGFEGAAVAIREALSGDFRSLVERFEIPRAEIQKLKDQGVPNLQIVQRALDGLGINDRLLNEQANNVTQRARILKDDLLRTLAGAAGPIQSLGSDAIAGLTRALNSPEVQRAVKQFGADLVPIADQLRRIAGDPATRQAVKDLATDALALASNLHQVAVGAQVVLGTIGPFVATVARGADTVHRVNDQLDLGANLLRAYAGGVAPALAGILALTDGIGGLERALAALNREHRVSVTLSGITGGLLDAISGVIDTAARDVERRFGLPAGTVRAGLTAGAGVQTTSQRVTPAPQRDYLPDEGREQDATARAIRAQRAAAQGQAALRGYLDGLRGPESLALFDQAEQFLAGRVDDLFSGLTAEGKQQRRSDATVLAARVAADIQRSGKLTEETVAAVGASFGDATPAIVAYLTQLAAAGTAQQRASAAARQLADAQAQLNRVTADGGAAIDAATARVEAAQRVADEHAQTVRDNVAELQRQQATLSDQAAEVARGYDEQAAALQRQQSALTDQAAEVARGYDARLDALQREREEVDRLTQAHRDEYQAQIDGLREVQNAKSQDETVKALEVKQRADLLALEERIRAARRKGTPEGEREARALEDQRALVQARGNYALDIARQRAAVAGDKADAAKKPIEDAAAAQATKDKAAADAIDARIKATQAEAKAAADDYAARERAIAAQISALQDEAKQVASDYAARERAIKAQIDAEEERGRVLAATDQRAITDAQARLTLAQGIASAQKGAAEFAVTMAGRAKTLADGELQAQKDLLGVLDQKNAKFGDFVKSWRDLFAAMQEAGVNPAVLNAYFGVGTIATPTNFTPSPSHPDVDPPLPSSSGQSVGQAARGAFPPASLYAGGAYAPPVPPASAASYLRATGAGAAANAGALRGGLTVNGPLVAVDTVRETAELGPLVDLAAVKAAQLSSRGRLAAMREDADGGGAASNWTRG